MSTTMFNIDNPDHSVTIPDGTILLSYRGSIAHNMYRPTHLPDSIDDVDLMGVVIGTESNYFGLHEWAHRGTKEIRVHHYDCVFYEIRKMFQLLLQGNPNVLTLLWTRPQEKIFAEGPGKSLLAARDLFSGRHVYNSFAGYAHQQLLKMESRDPAELRQYIALTHEAKRRGIHPNHSGERIPFPSQWDITTSGEALNASCVKDDTLLSALASYTRKGDNLGYLGDKRKGLVLKHGYDSKNAAHCIRLLRMAGEFLATGIMQVHRTDAEELLQIKRGEWELARVKSHAEELFGAMREAKEHSPLPEGPDTVAAEHLLVEILHNHILKSHGDAQ